jgi:hypothetical protein
MNTAGTFLCVTAGALAFVLTAATIGIVRDSPSIPPPPPITMQQTPYDRPYEPTNLKRWTLVGDITFSQRVRGCWTKSDCEWFEPGREWGIWELKNSAPGTWGYSVCITSLWLVADPEECAWATPTAAQVSRFNLVPKR